MHLMGEKGFRAINLGPDLLPGLLAFNDWLGTTQSVRRAFCARRETAASASSLAHPCRLRGELG